MKKLIKLVVLTLVLLTTIYGAYFYISPSITVVNKSGKVINDSVITLPTSQLNFGLILNNKQNTIYYSLSQSDGVYTYRLNINNSITLKGSCGYITHNELHKRFVIIIDSGNNVICKS